MDDDQVKALRCYYAASATQTAEARIDVELTDLESRTDAQHRKYQELIGLNGMMQLVRQQDRSQIDIPSPPVIKPFDSNMKVGGTGLEMLPVEMTIFD